MLSSCLVVQQQAARTTQLVYRLGGHEFVLQQRSKGSDFELIHLGDDFRFVRAQGRAWALPAPIKGYAFPDQARTYYQNAQFLSDLEAAYETAIDGIFYLGPLREYLCCAAIPPPPRSRCLRTPSPAEPAAAGDCRAVRAMGAAIAARASVATNQRCEFSGALPRPHCAMDTTLLFTSPVDDSVVKIPQEMTDREIKKYELRHGSGPRPQSRLLADNPPEPHDG
jgi:hypothetical protein